MSVRPTSSDASRVQAGAWARLRIAFTALAGVGLVLSAVGLLVDRAQFFHSYLTAFVFVLTCVLGCLFFVLLQHLSRAGWSVALRRIPEAAAWTIPFLAVFFLPLLLGTHDLYHWTHGEAVAHDELLQHKQGFLNLPFFVIRAVIYLGLWSLLARYFVRRSIDQDQSRDPMVTVQLQRRAAPAMILFALTLTFMAFDWLMSMDPHWYSTIFGVYIFAGSAVASFGFITVTAMALRRGGYLARTVRNDHFQDLGRLLFAFSVFWAYIAFSQYFLIWYGNIPEETVFYAHRMEGSWRGLSYFLAAGHFVVPFVLLMSRWTKRRPAFVTALGIWMMVMHYLDIYWLVMPNLHHHGVHPHWLDLVTVLGLGGLFLAVLVRKLAAQSLVPEGDPRLPESLALEHLY